MARRDQEPAKVRRVRMIIAGGLAAAALLVIAVGVRFVMQPLGEVDAGQHYVELPGAERPREPEVVVTEYFSYGCVHCRSFDPQIETWQEALPEGVRFERVPVAFSPAWRSLSAAYYAAAELDILDRNHERLFDAIHQTGLNLQTADALAQFFDGHGTDAEAFRRAMDSPSVRRAIVEADRRTRGDQIQAVPTLVVDGRYRISGGELSRRQVLAVADELVARELAARVPDTGDDA